MKLKIKIRGKEYNVNILEMGENVKINLGEKEFIFDKEHKEEDVFAKTSLPKRDFSKKDIQAPLSGTVSKVFIKKSDDIKKGDKIILLSAMKMENEIVSESEGNAKEVLVKEGQNVKEGDVLIIIE